MVGEVDRNALGTATGEGVDEKEQPHQGAFLCFVKENESHQGSAKPNHLHECRPCDDAAHAQERYERPSCSSFVIKFTLATMAISLCCLWLTRTDISTVAK